MNALGGIVAVLFYAGSIYGAYRILIAGGMQRVRAGILATVGVLLIGAVGIHACVGEIDPTAPDAFPYYE